MQKGMGNIVERKLPAQRLGAWSTQENDKDDIKFVIAPVLLWSWGQSRTGARWRATLILDGYINRETYFFNNNILQVSQEGSNLGEWDTLEYLGQSHRVRKHPSVSWRGSTSVLWDAMVGTVCLIWLGVTCAQSSSQPWLHLRTSVTFSRSFK